MPSDGQWAPKFRIISCSSDHMLEIRGNVEWMLQLHWKITHCDLTVKTYVVLFSLGPPNDPIFIQCMSITCHNGGVKNRVAVFNSVSWLFIGSSQTCIPFLGMNFLPLQLLFNTLTEWCTSSHAICTAQYLSAQYYMVSFLLFKVSL